MPACQWAAAGPLPPSAHAPDSAPDPVQIQSKSSRKSSTQRVGPSHTSAAPAPRFKALPGLSSGRHRWPPAAQASGRAWRRAARGLGVWRHGQRPSRRRAFEPSPRNCAARSSQAGARGFEIEARGRQPTRGAGWRRRRRRWVTARRRVPTPPPAPGTAPRGGAPASWCVRCAACCVRCACGVPCGPQCGPQCPGLWTAATGGRRANKSLVLRARVLRTSTPPARAALAELIAGAAVLVPRPRGQERGISGWAASEPGPASRRPEAPWHRLAPLSPRPPPLPSHRGPAAAVGLRSLAFGMRHAPHRTQIGRKLCGAVPCGPWRGAAGAGHPACAVHRARWLAHREAIGPRGCVPLRG